MAPQWRRDVRPKGFTLIELVIVIAVIAILAALLIPTILSQAERARKSDAMDMVDQLAKTIKRFHDDTGFWPHGNSVFDSRSGGPPSIDPTAFTVQDTVLFTNQAPAMPSGLPPLPLCSQPGLAPGLVCFNGPYLGRGGSMADPSMLDPWGQPIYFTIQRPFDGTGGGSSLAPNGVVAVWSIGPNGLDEVGCTGSAACTRDYSKIVQGLPSKAGADDIIKVSGTTVAQ